MWNAAVVEFAWCWFAYFHIFNSCIQAFDQENVWAQTTVWELSHGRHTTSWGSYQFSLTKSLGSFILLWFHQWPLLTLDELFGPELMLHFVSSLWPIISWHFQDISCVFIERVCFPILYLFIFIWLCGGQSKRTASWFPESMSVMLCGKGELKSQMEFRLLVTWIWTREINPDCLDGPDIHSFS